MANEGFDVLGLPGQTPARFETAPETPPMAVYRDVLRDPIVLLPPRGCGL